MQNRSPASPLCKGKKGHNDHSYTGLMGKTLLKFERSAVWEPRERAALFLGESEGFPQEVGSSRTLKDG